MTNPPPTPTAPADAGTRQPVTEHRFVVADGSVVIWQNLLRLQMDRFDAFSLMQSLIAQLRDGGNKTVEFQWMGLLTEEHDD